jgi:D-serine deaminase-like pyridoxal phosphate-dependent protein
LGFLTLFHPREVERAVHVIETAYAVKVTHDAGRGLFFWSQPGNGRSSVVTAVEASGLIEVARGLELAGLLRFEGVARDFTAGVSQWADELRRGARPAALAKAA